MTRPKPWSTAVLATVALAAVTALDRLGSSSLAAPPLGSPGNLADWFERRGPAVAALAVVRLVALGAGWYVVAVATAGTIARATGWARAARVADAALVPSLRRIAAGVVTASVVSAAPAAAQSAPATEIVLVRLPDEPGAGGESGGVATMRRLPEELVADPAPAPAPAVEPEALTWTVAPGDHLWGIARETLADVLGRAPTDAEVQPYWLAVVEHNRGRLAVPDDPDLLFAGQVVDLPPPLT